MPERITARILSHWKLTIKNSLAFHEQLTQENDLALGVPRLTTSCSFHGNFRRHALLPFTACVSSTPSTTQVCPTRMALLAANARVLSRDRNNSLREENRSFLLFLLLLFFCFQPELPSQTSSVPSMRLNIYNTVKLHSK